MNYKLVSIVVILFMIGVAVGYTYGFQDGVKWSVRLGLRFVDIDIDEDVLLKGIFQYKNHIGGCLFIENASIRSYSGNQERS